ncbi:MAG: bifunctional metallophosphatase/5'-nucleotidase [Cytophagales bacterium]|nr:bifunctional metallophosphatase/5'-nucleotidase [Cytophagales bacterium]
MRQLRSEYFFRKLLRLSSLLGLAFIILSQLSCSKDDDNDPDENEDAQYLTIFHVNDMHGQLDSFAKIKHIVDAAKLETNVLLVSGGDIFSGNPIVDQYSEKGYPIIDIMNQTGFDISVIGNHEFDYGQTNLAARMEQADFEWVCANVNTESSDLPQPEPYVTLDVGDVTITTLGLVETNGKPDDIIPATHPWRVLNLTFQWFYDVVDQYSDLKAQESADVYLALTHLGRTSDLTLANEYPYFDVIIGGHSNHLTTGDENGIPTLMAGKYLSHLGRLDLIIQNNEVVSHEATSIDLEAYTEEDATLAAAIQIYNDTPEFDEVIGYANTYHDKNALGCFYTTALVDYMQVDASFQNGGGIRAEIDQGDVTTLEIYNMDPFNNGSVIFTMTAREIKVFFIDSGARLHVSGITLEREDNDIIIRDEEGTVISDATELTIGINDYIPAVNDSYFPIAEADIKELTTAETIIEYLTTINSTIDYEGCNHYFYF